MDAVALVTNEASRIFFFLFWFFTNLLTLNLLVANILDAVSAQLDKIKEADSKASEEADQLPPYMQKRAASPTPAAASSTAAPAPQHGPPSS
jgi:hypothetical protein